MPKQMRKGTRSCLACRRRKVRCSLALKQSNVCDQCVRRNVPCLPQGRSSLSSTGSPVALSHSSHDSAAAEFLVSFFDALDSLRHWVSLPGVGASSSSSNHSSPLSRAASGPHPAAATTGSDFVQSNYSPVMKLFNDQRIGHQAGSTTNAHSNRPFDHQHDARLADLTKSTLCKMVAVMPSHVDIKTIFQTRGEWWETWRESFGLGWGEKEDETLESFAMRAVRSGNPSLLGSLLVCFALSTGDHTRYLGPVEHWVLSEDSFRGHVYDFQCMIALGLCLLSALQPCRAWSVFRTANTRLQLAGIHKTHRKSVSFDAAFWQIFGADRWISLMIGLPYSIPDHLCDLHIPEPTESTRISFHYQHLTVLTGRVIDGLQSNTAASLSKLVAVEEKIDAITAQLPPDYLDFMQISRCPDRPQKSARLYRISHIHQLKTFLYLPYFLQSCETQKEPFEKWHASQYGKIACANNARSFLEAFLALFDLDPTAARVDNSMKLSAFSALATGVVLYLNIISVRKRASRQPAPAESVEADMNLISRTISVLHTCSEDQCHSLCGQCHRALQELVSRGGTIDQGDSRQIIVPYFGSITISRHKENIASNSNGTRGQNDGSGGSFLDVNPAPCGSDASFDNLGLVPPTLLDDIIFSYQGPWESQEMGTDWLHQSVDFDLCQYGLDTAGATFWDSGHSSAFT